MNVAEINHPAGMHSGDIDVVPPYHRRMLMREQKPGETNANCPLKNPDILWEQASFFSPP